METRYYGSGNAGAADAADKNGTAVANSVIGYSLTTAASAGSSGSFGSNSTDSYAYDGGGGSSDNDYTPHELLLRTMWIYAGYPILVAGTAGHAAAIVTLLSRRRLRALPVAVHLLVMSVAGLLALYVGLLSTVVEQQTYSRVLLPSRTTEAGCRLQMAAVYWSLQLYSWMEACVAVERLIAVRWPHRYRVACTQRNNALVAVAVVVGVTALNAVPFAAYGYTPEGFCAVVDWRLFMDVWRYVHSAAYAALPVVVMLPCNALILYSLRARRRRSDGCAGRRTARSVTVMMCSLNAVFFVTTVPVMVGDWNGGGSASAGSGGGGGGKQQQTDAVDIAWCLCRLLMYLGSAATFVVYLVTGRRFRKSLKELALACRDSCALFAAAAATAASDRRRAVAGSRLPMVLARDAAAVAAERAEASLSVASSSEMAGSDGGILHLRWHRTA